MTLIFDAAKAVTFTHGDPPATLHTAHFAPDGTPVVFFQGGASKEQIAAFFAPYPNLETGEPVDVADGIAVAVQEKPKAKSA